jgi:hypothetical protein
MNYGFVDLRLDAGEGSGDEGFWPSFTDIMTVIVMIFMLAAVVLMVRNMDLIQQLRATMEAERQAALIARTTEEQKDALLIRTDAPAFAARQRGTGHGPVAAGGARGADFRIAGAGTG